jgi:hypothetical protein
MISGLMDTVRQQSAASTPAQGRSPRLARQGGSETLGAQVATLQRTIGNQGVMRLLGRRASARVAVQRYTEEDIRKRAQRIYELRTAGIEPTEPTEAQRSDANVQAGEKADWAQAERELRWIERRAHELYEQRRDHPENFPASDGPMSDWVKAEQEFHRQTGGATELTGAHIPERAAATVTDSSLAHEATQLHETIGKDMIAFMLTPHLDNPVSFANLRANYKQRYGSDVVSDIIAKHPFTRGGLMDPLKKAIDASNGATTSAALAQVGGNRTWIKEVKMLWRLFYGGNLEQEVRHRLAQQPEQLARSLFFLLGPGAAEATTHRLRVGAELASPAHAVDGGNVTASTGVQIVDRHGQATNLNNAFGFKFTGPDRPKVARTRWIQFIWREVQIQKPGQMLERDAGRMITSGGEYDLTSTEQINSGQWVFNVDVKEESETPYYEETGAAIRSNNATAIYDQPSAGYIDREVTSRLGGPGFAAGTTLTQVAHFDTFLTREAQTLFRYGLTVTDSWTKQTASRYSINCTQNKVHNLVLQQATNAIPPEFHGALKQKFPKYEFLVT